MATLYKCTNPDCGMEYPAQTHDESCGICNSLVKAVRVRFSPAALFARPETALECALAPVTEVRIEGMCALACDISISMHGRAFPNEQLTKLRLVCNAIEDAFAHMDDLSNKDTAFVTIIAYGRRATVITDRQGRPFIKSVAQILDEFGEPAARRKAAAEGLHWDDLTLAQKDKLQKEVGIGEYLHDQFVNDRPGVDPNATNITAALDLAREIADATLAGDLSRFGVPNSVSLIDQKQFWSPETGDIKLPNIRVVIYSDGQHNEGALRNAFATFPPRSVLMTAFLGDREASDNARNGSDQMKALANICPVHNRPGYFLVNSLLRSDYLRQLYHMSTGTSGLCPSCMRDEQVRLEEQDKYHAEDQTEDLTV